MTDRNYGVAADMSKLGPFVDKLVAMGLPIGFDIETGYDGAPAQKVSLHPEDPRSKIVGISFTNSMEWARYTPLGHDLAQNADPLEAARVFWRLLRGGQGVAHNAKFELRFMSRWFYEQLKDDDTEIVTADGPVGATYADEVGADPTRPGYFPVLSDTMIEAYIVGEYRSIALKSLTKEIFKHDQAEIATLFPGMSQVALKSLRFNTLDLTPEVVSYACEDSVWCLGLHQKHYPLVKDQLLYKVEMLIMPILCVMEDFGVKYDWAAMKRKAQEAESFLGDLNEEIQATLSALSGQPVSINLGSPKQIETMLFDTLGMPSSKRTNTGGRSTDAIALEGLSKKYPVVQRIREWKEMKKLLSTYLQKYQLDYDYAPDGMTHPNHMQTAVGTGRFAVSDPPYQQTPKKYHYVLDSGREFELNFRDLIIAPDDHYILGYDYSQVELRMLAGESGEPTLLRAFDTDEDVHTATASLMLGIPREQITKDQRAIGKTMNFALLYGMGASSLAQRLGITKEEGRDLYDKYFSAYSAINVWVEKVTREGKSRGFSLSKFGRKFTIWELTSNEAWQYSKGERLCVNAPIQGAAADYMKIAMTRAYAALRSAGLHDRVHMVMNIHDALEFYVHKSVNPQDVIDALYPAVVFPVAGLPKIVADWHVGKSWGTLTELHIVDGQALDQDNNPVRDLDIEALLATVKAAPAGEMDAPEDLFDEEGGAGQAVLAAAVGALRGESYSPDSKGAMAEEAQASAALQDLGIVQPPTETVIRDPKTEDSLVEPSIPSAPEPPLTPPVLAVPVEPPMSTPFVPPAEPQPAPVTDASWPPSVDAQWNPEQPHPIVYGPDGKTCGICNKGRSMQHKLFREASPEQQAEWSQGIAGVTVVTPTATVPVEAVVEAPAPPSPTPGLTDFKYAQGGPIAKLPDSPADTPLDIVEGEHAEPTPEPEPVVPQADPQLAAPTLNLPATDPSVFIPPTLADPTPPAQPEPTLIPPGVVENIAAAQAARIPDTFTAPEPPIQFPVVQTEAPVQLPQPVQEAVPAPSPAPIPPATLSPEAVVSKSVIITIQEMPDGATYGRFKEWLGTKPGINTVKLVTPAGEVEYDSKFGITPEDQSIVSMILNGATVNYAPESVSFSAVANGLQF